MKWIHAINTTTSRHKDRNVIVVTALVGDVCGATEIWQTDPTRNHEWYQLETIPGVTTQHPPPQAADPASAPNEFLSDLFNPKPEQPWTPGPFQPPHQPNP